MQKGIWFHGSGVRKFNFFLSHTVLRKSSLINILKATTANTQSNLHRWVCFYSMYFTCVYWIARKPDMFNSYANGAQLTRQIICIVLWKKNLHEVKMRLSFSGLQMTHTPSMTWSSPPTLCPLPHSSLLNSPGNKTVLIINTHILHDSHISPFFAVVSA